MKTWKIYVSLLVTYLAMHVASIFFAPVMVSFFHTKFGMEENEAVYNGFAWSLFILNFIAAVIIFTILVRNRSFLTLFKGKKSSIGVAIGWGILGFFLAMGGQMLAAGIESLIGIEMGSDSTALLGEIAKMSPIMLLPIVLFAPFLEEIIFRRVLFGGIYLRSNYWVAAILSGLIFAAVHMEFEHILMYLAPALIFSYLYYRTKRLITPMISHFLMNGFVAVAQLNIDKLEQFQDMKQALILFGIH